MQVRRLLVLLLILGLIPGAFLLARAQRATVQAAAVSPTQDIVSTWYPIHPGDTWVYQKESDDGGSLGMAHPLIERWKTEETITSVSTTPEGTLVAKRIKVFDRVMINGWLAANDRTRRELPVSHMLIHQNCLYVLDGIDVRDAGNDFEGYRNDLLQGNIAPDFCFPIDKDSTWGKVPHTSPAEEWVWRVRGLNADPFGVKGGRTYHFTTRVGAATEGDHWSHAGSGTELDRWFEPGVGVLQEIMEHHGHYDEDRRQLLRSVIDGKSKSYDLKPARTVPLSTLDCSGIGWKHFVRENGSSFAGEAACVVYAGAGKYAPR